MTQNVDQLHYKAGSSQVVEVSYFSFIKCNYKFGTWLFLSNINLSICVEKHHIFTNFCEQDFLGIKYSQFEKMVSMGIFTYHTPNTQICSDLEK